MDFETALLGASLAAFLAESDAGAAKGALFDDGGDQAVNATDAKWLPNGLPPDLTGGA